MDIGSVARRAGVSTATVSRVLNRSSKVREETAIRVRRIIEELKYVPNNAARTLRSGRSNLYGVIVSDIRNPFFPDLIEHFESLATQHGIDVTVANTGYNGQRLLNGVRRLLEREVDGIAVLTSEVNAELISILRESHVPAVFLNQPSAIADFRNITVDYVRGFHEAVEHLRMLGHERIGFIAGPRTFSSAERRRKAFLTAVRLCDIELRKEWILEGDHQISGGQFAAERIFAMRKRPTAVICSNDMTAIGMLHEANRLGRKLPQELSLIGFDDLLLSEIVKPALTTLHLSRRDIATRAFFSLQASSQIGPQAQTSTIQPRLVVRASTAPIGRK